MQRHTAAAALFVLLYASTALADAVLVPGLTYTALSGFEGTNITAIGAPSDQHAVSYLSAGERFNAPCYLSVYKAEINGAVESIYANWNECTTTSPNKSTGFLTGSGLYVYGIEACTNSNANHRLKGIRVYGAAIRSDGTVQPLGLFDWFDRANCSIWHGPVVCPAGQIATKVRIHHTADEINGLSLACREVTEQ